MKVPVFALVVAALVFGFLVASTIYFYDQTRVSTTKKSVDTNSFVGPVIKEPSSNQPNLISQYTQPDSDNGRISYPANIYTVGSGETLATIASKLGEDQQYIANANSISDPNSIQQSQPLAIPVLNTTTYFYRLNFIVSQSQAEQTVISQRASFDADLTDPVKVAKSDAIGYYNIDNTSSFTLENEDLSKGEATVSVSKPNYTAMIGLIQPKTLGKDGFWAIVYIEEQDSSSSAN